MKPRIYLKHSFIDCGWRYEQWVCESICLPSGADCIRVDIGIGGTPKAAYDDWARQVGK